VPAGAQGSIIVSGVIRWIVIAAVVLLVLALGFTIAAGFFPDFREASRDIFLVFAAAFHLIAAFLVIVLLVTILYAVKSLHDLIQVSLVPKIEATTTKVDEVLDNTRSIVGNVKDSSETISTTTTYTAERVVSPIIRVSSLIVGVRAAATALARRDVPADDVQHAQTPGEPG
jgi:phage-related protein